MAAVVLAALWGAAAGIAGAFVAPSVVWIGTRSVPWGAVAALAAVALAVVVGARTAGPRPGGAAALFGWLLAVFVLSQPRAAGDLVVPGDAAGYVFLIGGLLVGGLTLAVVARDPAPSAPPAARR